MTIHPRRSVLYMPGSNARALEKARTIAADALILDLEDAVAPDAKDLARQQVAEAVTARGFGKREVIVRIIDDGPGFPPDERDRLFELFFRSSQTARAAAGAGIGLFVCARRIKAMGGRIWATSRPEGGAEFGFSLRIMSEDD